MSEDPPMMMRGNGFQTEERNAISGATIPPTLEKVEHAPTAVDLISVGNSSDVYTNTTKKEADAPNLPTMARVT